MNTVKIVFMSIFLLTGLVFITAKKPNPTLKNIDNNSTLNLSLEYMPPYFDLVGGKSIKKYELFKKGEKALLVIGNHDSLAVIKDFRKYFMIDIKYVTVANISSAPWFVKEWLIPQKLEELTKDFNDTMIYDSDGYVVNSLLQTDSSAQKFFAYIINTDGSIEHIYTGSVKEGAIDNSMSDEEKKSALKPLNDLLK